MQRFSMSTDSPGHANPASHLFLWFACGSLLLGAENALLGETITLTDDGTSSYVITLSAEATPPVVTAASELQKFLAQVTGVTIPIETEQCTPATRRPVSPENRIWRIVTG